MKLHEIGEFGYIDRFSPGFRHLLQPDYLGIGDDCAIFPANREEDYVVTTDMLVENVHFLRDRISPRELGYKSLAVNLSDIAAMGAEPLGSFLSVGIHGDTEVAYLDAFMDGFHELSSEYNVPLMGGDTTKSPEHFVINVAIAGKCARGRARLRSMAEEGDRICVTGTLGDSAGGLNVLLQDLDMDECKRYLVQKHHLPEPRIREGIWLSGREGVHAMIDVSDGISSDLVHILRASGKSATVDAGSLPVSEQLKTVAGENDWNAAGLAASGGEDYELLCTVDAGSFDALNREFTSRFKKPLYPIGEITGGDARVWWTENGKDISLENIGYNHFTSG
jgi:thiamine-monophosphate kinase